MWEIDHSGKAGDRQELMKASDIKGYSIKNNEGRILSLWVAVFKQGYTSELSVNTESFYQVSTQNINLESLLAMELWSYIVWKVSLRFRR